MAAALPGQVVIVVEGIVTQDLGIGAGPDRAGIKVQILFREARIELLAERYANFAVARDPKIARGVSGNAVVPADAGKPDAGFIDNRGGEGMNPAAPAELAGINVD